DVEVQALGRDAGALGVVHDHRLVGLVRHDEVDGLQHGAVAVGIRQRAQLVDHLGEVALHQRLHLGAVHGDVVVELGIGPDDRVHLAHGPAGVSLVVLHVGGGALGRGTDHHGGGAVAEAHARGAHGAALGGALLVAPQ